MAPSPQAQPKQDDSNEHDPVEQLKAWLPKVEADCDAYKAAPNEIKKSTIFRDHKALLRAVSIKDAKGTLTKIRTDQGGDELDLTIEVGSAKFGTESLASPIKRGTKVYKQATDLQEGQCVVFSAKGIEANSVMEESKVCDQDYFAKFTDVRPCK